MPSLDPLDPLSNIGDGGHGVGDGGLSAFISSSGLIHQSAAGLLINNDDDDDDDDDDHHHDHLHHFVSGGSSMPTNNMMMMNMMMPSSSSSSSVSASMMMGGGPGQQQQQLQQQVAVVGGGGVYHPIVGDIGSAMMGLTDDPPPPMFFSYCRCQRCGYGGSDLRMVSCGCLFHTRCFIIPDSTNSSTATSGESPLKACPACSRPAASGTAIELLPMSFEEIDLARKEAQEGTANSKNKKNANPRKRKGAPGTNDGGNDGPSVSGAGAAADAMLDASMGVGYVSEKRTGRWSNEEMALCDKLIAKFESGELPIGGTIKLNEFLGNMLKSKQSRLTKKMKNAKLSSRTFQKTVGAIKDDDEARVFSELEDSFFKSLSNAQERAEIRFHMQREWRENFSQYCASIGQAVGADEWLSSVEEMDRRSSQAKDAARMAKRKVMMGLALFTDRRNQDPGVVIESSELDELLAFGMPSNVDGDFDEHHEIVQLLSEEAKNTTGSHDINGKSSLLHSAPFLAKTVAYLQRHNVPFEHVDLWVPSFVPTDDMDLSTNNCRLCFAGSATLDDVVEPDGTTKKPMSEEDQFKMYAFGDYSQKFSFDVGCGLPGRVYESGRPTWEQGVHNAPHHHFERCGGALQWGIKTVLGIPIASPNVGRIVVTLYSKHDRPKDQDLVCRLSEEFTRLMPSPKWKLVVDVGDEILQPEPETGINTNQKAVSSGTNTNGEGIARDPRIDEVVSILGELMPSDPHSALAPYLSGFMSLRLLLLRPSRSPEEENRARTMLDSFSAYSQGGRSKADIGMMLARDYMHLTQSNFNTNQNNNSQQVIFFDLGQGVASNNASSSAQAPSLSGNLEFEINSPLLGPISLNDGNLSIVSN